MDAALVASQLAATGTLTPEATAYFLKHIQDDAQVILPAIKGNLVTLD
jgi:hypothetical protein